MRYSLKKIFRNRKKSFSESWFAIVETRFVLCLVILGFSWLTSAASLKNIVASTVLYAGINFLLGLWDSNKLRLKKIRAIPALLDVVFVSSLICFTGGQTSPWFLLYVFPIISVSRYLSYEGSLTLWALTAVAYILATYISTPSVDYYSLALKCMVLLGIALVAGNLTRHKEESLLEIFKEVDNAILDNSATNNVLRLILRKALELTRSDMAQMKLLNIKGSSTYTLTCQSEHFQHVWDVTALFERHAEKAIKSKKYSAVRRLVAREGVPTSSLFVPLILNDEVIAIIALYSGYRLHYSRIEAVKLGSFAQLLGIVRKNDEMYQEIVDSDHEKQARLKMLYEIGEHLKVEEGLENLFEKVVEVMYNQLDSEEAALFIAEKENRGLIRKVAVRGPNEEITEKLRDIERPYEPGESWVGEIFQSRKYKHENHVPLSVIYQDEYSKTLPSGKVRHYIGVPLVIGKEVLGVIRVINKRAATYSTENDSFKLSDNGFNEEDVELLQTIASQVASAIRSASFIEVQRYHQELVENSPDPIIVLDEKGRVKIFNKACEKIWGFSADEVNGKLVTNYYESEKHAREIGKLLGTKANHRIRDYQARIKHRDGEVIPIHLSASLLYNNQGNKIGSIGVFKDLRDTIRLQQEITNAEKLATLGRLAHTIGHEIKHDIATGLSYIDTLAYECDDEELSEIYRDIQDTLHEAVDKFQNMLMIGRPKPPERRLINQDDIYNRVAVALRRRAHSKKVEFTINSPDAYELEADVEQLKQVVSNLFDNSIDAITAKKSAGNKGRIELTTQASNGDLHIIWQDNGCGIPAKILPRLFTPFTTTKQSGTGLGLFIIRGIIENHGGNISVESEEGKWTRFMIKLPLHKRSNHGENK
ncbi:MAG TPA: ATP-binding protein [Pyrinomonadaceae bacterium]|nr:ATP-binding protein [Pyrinomonadaceae bacterium]